MEQHPVPQHIAAFKFKLFGNLTARQFFTLIIPLSLAALIFFSDLPAIIRFPLALVIGIFAFVIALIPINGQPFDKWAVSFIKAVMSPTQRVWVKEKKIPDFLTVISAPRKIEKKIPEELTTQKQEKLMAYLKTLPKESGTPLDVKEQIALKDIDFSIDSFAPVIPQQPKTKKVKPPIIWPTSPQITVTQSSGVKTPTTSTTKSTSTLEKVSIESGGDTKTPVEEAVPKPLKYSLEPQPIQPKKILVQTTKPRVASHAKPYVLKGIEKRLPKKEPEEEYVELIKTPAVNLASDTNYSLDNVIPMRTPDNQIVLVHGIGQTRARKLHFAPPVNFDISKLPIRGEKRFEVSNELKKRMTLEEAAPPVTLPVEQPVHAPPISKPQIQVPKTIPQKAPVAPKPPGQQVVVNAPAQTQTQAPQFSVTDAKQHTVDKKPLSSAEIVPLTKTPNVISGLISDASGGPISGAVLVIRDSNGIPVRALKTNKLGQFLSTTPLSDDTYTVEIESDLANIRPITINLKNQIVPPISIVAEGVKNGPR